MEIEIASSKLFEWNETKKTGLRSSYYSNGIVVVILIVLKKNHSNIIVDVPLAE